MKYKSTAAMIGIICGVVLAVAILQATDALRHPAAPRRVMLSECDGGLRKIVLQYAGGAGDVVIPVYREFLRQLNPDVIVYVECPDRAAFAELSRAIAGHELIPIFTGHPMTAWSRDRWIALDSANSRDPAMLLAPRGEDGAAAWPARAGDEQVAFDLADALPDQVIARRSDLYFDGGDLLADEENVFVTPAVLRRNIGRTLSSRDQLTVMLRRETGKNVVVLDAAPDHHAGMFMMAASHHTMVVGDPRLGQSLLADAAVDLPGGADNSDAAQEQFDSVAGQIASLGYRVVRIPTALSPDHKTYLTYVNVIIDCEAGRPIVYLPQYRGAESMNAAAAQVWRGLGYEVRQVDCTSTYRFFGNLHCLVNILRRT